MGFSVLIPARLASTRLPGKPLADIGGLPMVVRVARRAAEAGADQVVVAGDDERIVQACAAHGVRALLTRSDHASGSDRLAEACALLGLDGAQVVVNVQGDEPLIDPALVRQCADLLQQRQDCVMSTAAHPIDNLRDYLDSNIVKVVLDAQGLALYFSRAPIPWWRDGGRCRKIRHLCGTWGCMRTALRSCAHFRRCRLRPSSAPRHWSNCARCGTATASRCMSARMPRARAWTRPRTWSGCARCSAEGGGV
jgi:3-deoxy-D-manno-octulosonate cytidylyltransferase